MMLPGKFIYIKLFTLIVLTALCQSLQAQQKPNVIFILADDLGYGDLGSYGQRLINTPNIDSLAAKGIRFTQFYAGTSVCAPSRASLMTGLHTGHTTIRGNKEIFPEGQFPLADTSFTIAKLFKNEGYATGLFGKWGLGYPGSTGDPLKQGFDAFYGYNCQRMSHNFFPNHLWRDSIKKEFPNNIIEQNEYAPELIQKQALDFINDHKNQPFLLFLTYTLPHAALQLPENDNFFKFYHTKFKEEKQNIPAKWNGTGYQPQAYPKATYAAMVSRLDEYVGEVVKKLKSLKMEDNTIIVFTSDNGSHKEGGNMPEFFNSNGGLKGFKRDLYEGGIRVPMIVKWPKVIKEGTQVDVPFASWDFLATFSDIIKQKPVVNTDGISFLPTLKNHNQQHKHSFFYWEFHEDGGKQAVRIGDWKGVRLNVKKNENASIQLFNLALDAFESQDVSKTNLAIVEEMITIMNNEHNEVQGFQLFSGKEKGNKEK